MADVVGFVRGSRAMRSVIQVVILATVLSVSIFRRAPADDQAPGMSRYARNVRGTWRAPIRWWSLDLFPSTLARIPALRS